MYKIHQVHSRLLTEWVASSTQDIWWLHSPKIDLPPLFFVPGFPALPSIYTYSPLFLQAMVLSMLSVSLLLNTQSPVSSQSPTRRFIPSAQRNCWRSNTRVNTLLSSYGTHPSTLCRGTTSLSSRRWYPLTTCVWDAWAEVRGHTLEQIWDCSIERERESSEFLLHLTVWIECLINVFVWVRVNVKCFCGWVCACDCAQATRILSCHISVYVLEEKKKIGPLVGLWFKQTRLIHSNWVWKNKKKKPLLFLTEWYTNKAATNSLLAACPLCKIVV